MSDTLSAARLDSPPPNAGARAGEPEILVPASSPSASAVPASPERPIGSEPLSRIEDKTSRIEEKLARSEAAMQRVVDRFELASARMNEVALQSDLTAVRSEVAGIAHRVRRTPGAASLFVTAVITAILTAAAVVLVLKYAPGMLAR